MKIALCLSGQPRYIDEGYKHIYKHIIKVYNPDIFVHTWWDKTYIGKKFSFSPHASDRSGKWDNNTISYIMDKYNPTKIKIEKQKQFDVSLYEGANFSNSSPFNNMSMYYSLYQSNLLKKEYETDNNFLYDVVIRCRFDITFDIFNFNINELDLNSINLCSAGVHKNYIPKNRDELKNNLLEGEITFFNDQFAISNSKNMDYYSNLFNKSEEYWVRYGATPMGERGLTFHLNMSDININIMGGDKLYNNILKL